MSDFVRYVVLSCVQQREEMHRFHQYAAHDKKIESSSRKEKEEEVPKNSKISLS